MYSNIIIELNILSLINIINSLNYNIEMQYVSD